MARQGVRKSKNSFGCFSIFAWVWGWDYQIKRQSTPPSSFNNFTWCSCRWKKYYGSELCAKLITCDVFCFTYALGLLFKYLWRSKYACLLARKMTNNKRSIANPSRNSDLWWQAYTGMRAYYILINYASFRLIDGWNEYLYQKYVESTCYGST
jgi:hypothetical protein